MLTTTKHGNIWYILSKKFLMCPKGGSSNALEWNFLSISENRWWTWQSATCNTSKSNFVLKNALVLNDYHAVVTTTRTWNLYKQWRNLFLYQGKNALPIWFTFSRSMFFNYIWVHLISEMDPQSRFSTSLQIKPCGFSNPLMTGCFCGSVSIYSFTDLRCIRGELQLIRLNVLWESNPWLWHRKHHVLPVKQQEPIFSAIVNQNNTYLVFPESSLSSHICWFFHNIVSLRTSLTVSK